MHFTHTLIHTQIIRIMLSEVSYVIALFYYIVDILARDTGYAKLSTKYSKRGV